MKLIGIFSEHPNEFGMSYFQHKKFALKLSLRLLNAAFYSLIHAFFPFLFTNYASIIIQELHDMFNQHRNRPYEE